MRYVVLLFAGLLFFNKSYSQLIFKGYEMDNITGEDCDPFGYTIYNNKMFFSGKGFGSTYELMMADGSPNIQELSYFSPSAALAPRGFTIYKGKLYFFALNQIWLTDGSVRGTQFLKDVAPGSNEINSPLFTEFKNNLYFNASNSDHLGYELSITDGSAVGTKIFKDINPGSFSSNPSDFFVFNNHLFFVADDSVHGRELWISDGTQAGTKLLKDINPVSDSDPRGFIVVNNKLVFHATENMNQELWLTDGTSSGTQKIKNISSFYAHSTDQLVKNDKLYFVGNDGISGNELWISDGTAIGTVLVKDINPGSASSTPGGFIEYNNKVYFHSSDDISGNELWKSDGTLAGTGLVKDIKPGKNGSSPIYLFPYKNQFYFLAADSGISSKIYLYKSDGSVPGTFPIVQFRIISFSGFFLFKDLVYYSEWNKLHSFQDTTGSANGIFKSGTADLNFNVFPNPTQGNFHIALPSNYKAGNIKMFDISGKEIYSKEIAEVDKMILVELKDISKGIYFIRFMNKEFVQTKKLVFE